MKAAVLQDIGDLQVVEIPDPDLHGEDIVIKVKACGVCRTDWKAYTLGQRDLKLPRILGHEITGTIAAMPSADGRFRAGDQVQVSPGLPCGRCHYCRRGWDHLCAEQQVLGFNRDGGFAEYLQIPAQTAYLGVLNLIPEHISPAEASLVEPLACSLNMQESMDTGPADDLIIWGLGPLGILNARLARARGVANVIGIESNPTRYRFARELGLACCLNPERHNLAAEISLRTGRRGATAAITCCADANAWQELLHLLGKRGRLGYFSGLTGERHMLAGELNPIHYLELTVLGAYGCSTRHNRLALQMIAKGAVITRDIITRKIGLAEIETALKGMTHYQTLKTVVEF